MAMIELLVDGRARLGECILWCAAAQALYWTDIEGARLFRRGHADGLVREWPMPEKLGSFALCDDPTRLLLGLATGVALFDIERGNVGDVARIDMALPSMRINDGRCDPQGRFVFGTFNAVGATIGDFHRVSAGLALERLPLPRVAIANSIAFDVDVSRLYFTDTPTRRIHCADYHADGRVGVPRLFVELGAHEGFPDGSTVDAEGGLWNAQWDGGCVVRYGRDGIETARIPLPASRPTCPAFGGPALDRLFVSSARIGLDDAALASQPGAGGVFATTPAHRGRPEHRFKITR